MQNAIGRFQRPGLNGLCYYFPPLAKSYPAIRILFHTLHTLARLNSTCPFHRAPSLPEIPLRKIHRSADHGRNAGAHAAARGQSPSPKHPQATQKVKTLLLLSQIRHHRERCGCLTAYQSVDKIAFSAFSRPSKADKNHAGRLSGRVSGSSVALRSISKNQTRLGDRPF